MGLSVTHLIILLVIIVLIFGTKKLKNIGTDLGAAVKGFKEGVKSGGDAESSAPAAPPQQVTTHKTDTNTVDVEAKTKS